MITAARSSTMEQGSLLAEKPKVVFVLGATATGKSKLAIPIAKRFNGEMINAYFFLEYS
jgi:adenylate dimethylallyltransferase (cytokinin synthase)